MFRKLLNWLTKEQEKAELLDRIEKLNDALHEEGKRIRNLQAQNHLLSKVAKAKELTVKEGDIVLCQVDAKEQTPWFMDELRRRMKNANTPPCVLLLCDTLDDMQVLDEARMNELGWVKLENTAARDI